MNVYYYLSKRFMSTWVSLVAWMASATTRVASPPLLAPPGQRAYLVRERGRQCGLMSGGFVHEWLGTGYGALLSAYIQWEAQNIQPDQVPGYHVPW